MYVFRDCQDSGIKRILSGAELVLLKRNETLLFTVCPGKITLKMGRGRGGGEVPEYIHNCLLLFHF